METLVGYTGRAAAVPLGEDEDFLEDSLNIAANPPIVMGVREI
jgi:hypothetical protein